MQKFLWALVSVMLIGFPSCALAVSEGPATGAQRSARSIAVLADYSGVVVPVEEKVRMNVRVENHGAQDETVDLRVAPVPTSWRASLHGGEFTVTGVAVPAGKSQTVAFEAEPAKGVRPGTYVFGITGATPDGQVASRATVTIAVRERNPTAPSDLQATTAYPVLRGQTNSTFDFTLDVANKADTDRTVNLAAQVPAGWQVNFKPAYESKLISSVAIRADSNQTITVSLTPAPDATPGDYPVLVRFSAGASRTEVPVHVNLTGTYTLEVSTPTGLLSTNAVRGQSTRVALIVKNTGSAVNQNIRLTSFKPEDWKVEFKPDKLEMLVPGASQTVDATIIPAASALVGDYSLNLTADGEKGSSKSLDLRVAVAPSATWVWVGVGLIILSIGGMGGLFVWLGRR